MYFHWVFWVFGVFEKILNENRNGSGADLGSGPILEAWRRGRGDIGLRNTCVFIWFFGFVGFGIAKQLYFHLVFLVFWVFRKF